MRTGDLNLDAVEFSKVIPDIVYKRVIPEVKKSGGKCYMMGGFVRDWILGTHNFNTVRDYDFINSSHKALEL